MATIIQFNPDYKNNNIGNKKPIQQPQTQYPQQIQQQPIEDTFEFVDSIIEDDVSSKQKKVSAPKTPIKELVYKAWDLYDKALKTKKNVNKLITKAEANNFQDMLNSKGNLVTFEDANWGKMVMIECDENARDKRRTTFTPYENKITRITTIPHTQIIFFDMGKDYTEIIKTSKPNILGNSTKEVYCYEYGRPISYSKYKQSFFSNEEVLTETCTFNT